MALHERKSHHWGWILAFIIGGIIFLFAWCDFMPQPQMIEKKIIHTVQ